MLTILILAGGKGKRLAPISTDEKPKQFLKYNNEISILQQTFYRAQKIVGKEQIFIATNEKYENEVRGQLSDVKYENMILEPYSRNTAPAILLGVMRIKQIYKNANVLVMPSDHIIGEYDKFIDALRKGQKFLDHNEKAIITFGIKPSRPETHYGYIKSNINKNNQGVYKSEGFVEKPSPKIAVDYLKKGNYLWNSGMYLFKGDNMLRLADMFLHETYKILCGFQKSTDEEYNINLKEKYKVIENVSIDYGIMEKCDDIHVIPCEFKWDDIGSFQALRRNDITIIK